MLHDLARLGDASLVVERIRELSDQVDGVYLPARLAHTEALVAKAAAAAARAFTRDGWLRRASEARQRALRLAYACEGARPPGLSDDTEVTPLTRREREVAELAATRSSVYAVVQSSPRRSVTTSNEGHPMMDIQMMGIQR